MPSLRRFRAVIRSQSVIATIHRQFTSSSSIADVKLLLRLAGLGSDGSDGDLKKRLSTNGEMSVSGQSALALKDVFDDRLENVLKAMPKSLHEAFFIRIFPMLHTEDELRHLIKRCSEERAHSITCLAEATEHLAMSEKLRIASMLTCSLSGRPSNQLPVALRSPKELPSCLKGAGLLEAEADSSDSEDELADESEEKSDISSVRRNAILNFDVQQHGVAGLSSDMLSLLQRAVLSRALSIEELDQLGMTHERGLLLFGPPGCGKTLIARALGQILHATTVQIVSAAEINQKLFGESEKRMNALFDRVRESERRGDSSDLHLIVMDEIDALGAERSTRESRNHESALNVLLSCMDGFESNNCSLVVGLTNRKDKLDAALLRPGRLGVHIEVLPPDVESRLHILQIHAKALVRNDLMGANVTLHEIAEQTKGYTGAQLRQLVNNAISIALIRSGKVQRQFVDRAAFITAIAETSRNVSI